MTSDPRGGAPAVLAFRYAASHLVRSDRVYLFTPELPLTDAVKPPPAGAPPPGWVPAGRRPRRLGTAGDQPAPVQQPGRRPRRVDLPPRLKQLVRVAELVEGGEDLPPSLLAAAGHGTSIGGARPKALLTEGGRRLIAKFSSTTDTRPVVKAEAVAMMLALIHCAADRAQQPGRRR